jgi:putative GTP pyrophosphokinase
MAIREKVLGVDLEEFLEEHDLPRRDFDKTGLKADELDAIARDHASKKDQLTNVANLVANTLQQVPDVHSIKSRIKSPDSLAAKLIRKRIETPDRVINIGSYEKEITDLIGVRALHLFKGQWKPISDFTRKEWVELEQPVAYYRAGDAEEVVQAFQAAGLRTEARVAGYRSVHHSISCSPGRKAFPVEIQIRTVFEEAWAEIDHIVRYPRTTGNPELAGFLKLFNSFAGTADDMGTYLMTLRQWLSDHKESVARERTRADKLEAQVARLKISDLERRELQREIDAMRNAPAPPSPPFFVSTNTAVSSNWAIPEVSAFTTGVNLNITPEMVNPEVVKSCPNGHVFKAPSIVIGLQSCPVCNAWVT